VIARLPWFDRTFPFDLPVGLAPSVVERLRGTPARLEERTRGVDAELLRRRADGRWSIQENVGHLWDLESLWLARVDDLALGRPELQAADLANRRTYDADHNTRALAELLAGFRDARARLVATLERAQERDWMRAALHPRLRAPMRLLDLATFVAEHDDHHLATMSALLASFGDGGPPLVVTPATTTMRAG
jgi:uncharacterized damage-inducible protein DinB